MHAILRIFQGTCDYTAMASKEEEWHLWNFARDSGAPAQKSSSSDVPQARTLEEGLEAAAKYDGDPLECPCIQHMKEGKNAADSQGNCARIKIIFRLYYHHLVYFGRIEADPIMKTQVLAAPASLQLTSASSTPRRKTKVQTASTASDPCSSASRSIPSTTRTF